VAHGWRFRIAGKYTEILKGKCVWMWMRAGQFAFGFAIPPSVNVERFKMMDLYGYHGRYPLTANFA
jgi:hypothetical protein